MKEKNSIYKFVQWCSPQELHKACLNWISNLEFIRDEQVFLNDVIKNYTLDLLTDELYQKTVQLSNQLQQEEKQITMLLDKLQVHRNGLMLMLDGVDQIEQEKKYREDHFQLKMEIASYEFDYRCTKKEIFDLVAFMFKQRKPKQLKE